MLHFQAGGANMLEYFDLCVHFFNRVEKPSKTMKKVTRPSSKEKLAGMPLSRYCMLWLSAGSQIVLEPCFLMFGTAKAIRNKISLKCT